MENQARRISTAPGISPEAVRMVMHQLRRDIIGEDPSNRTRRLIKHAVDILNVSGTQDSVAEVVSTPISADDVWKY